MDFAVLDIFGQMPSFLLDFRVDFFVFNLSETLPFLCFGGVGGSACRVLGCFGGVGLEAGGGGGGCSFSRIVEVLTF